MRVTRRDVVFTGNYLRVVKKYFSRDGEESGVWETVEVTNIGDRGAVVVIALTEEREVILERNWKS